MHKVVQQPQLWLAGRTRKAQVLFAWDHLGGAVRGVLQPHHAAHLACWPWGLACLPLQPGGLAPASTVSRKEWALLDFCHLQQERLCLWLWGLRFHTPKGCASGSQTPSMRLPSLGSWIKQQWNGFSVSVSFLHQSDKLPPSPFVPRPLLHSPYPFLTFSVSGILVIRLLTSSDDLLYDCILLTGDFIFLMDGRKKRGKCLRL